MQLCQGIVKAKYAAHRLRLERDQKSTLSAFGWEGGACKGEFPCRPNRFWIIGGPRCMHVDKYKALFDHIVVAC
jgi:hypothetical protein